MEVSVAACIEQCVAKGIEYAGIIEHLGGWRHPLESLFDLMAEFRQLEPEIPVAIGMEVNTRDTDGTLDGTEADKEAVNLDFVLAESSSTPEHIASVEAFIEYDHRCQMAATQISWVDVIVHPWTTQHGRLQKAGYDGEWRFSMIPEAYFVEWADALAAHRTACEINTKNIAFFDEPLYLHFIDLLVERRVHIAVGSDAHRLEGIGSAEPIYDFLEARQVPPELIWFPSL
jgi:histidinol phosphatase-like PHP family hydrolase